MEREDRYIDKQIDKQKATVHSWERVDDLQLKGLKIIQNPKYFCFGMDSVLISDFAKIRKNDIIVDLGTGNGIIPLLLYGRHPDNQYFGFELQKNIADIAKRSIALNRLEDKIKIIKADILKAPKILGHLSVEVVVANPPYGEAGKIIPSKTENIHMARHESHTTIRDWVRSAQLLLKGKGRFYVVFPAARLLEITDEMRLEKIEPKRIRMVYSKLSKEPKVALIEGVKGAKPGLRFERPLVVYDESGQQTQEIRDIYGLKQ